MLGTVLTGLHDRIHLILLKSLGKYFSKGGSQTSSIDIAWEPVSNVNFNEISGADIHLWRLFIGVGSLSCLFPFPYSIINHTGNVLVIQQNRK